MGMHRGPGAGLAQVDELAHQGDLENYVYLHATRADLLRRLGQAEAARISYRRAIELARNAAERVFLECRLRDVEGS
jgi:RNA polymerase sigma-70 factor (ECF subfamily)